MVRFLGSVGEFSSDLWQNLLISAQFGLFSPSKQLISLIFRSDLKITLASYAKDRSYSATLSDRPNIFVDKNQVRFLFHSI